MVRLTSNQRTLVNLLTGVPTKTKAEEALSLLVARYEQTAIWDSTVPSISPEHPEALARHLVSMALAGSFVQYGAVAGIRHALDGFLKNLGVQHLYQLAGADKTRIEQAVWVYLRSIPERQVSEAAKIIRRSAHALACINNNFSAVPQWDAQRLRKFISGFVVDEPVPALAMMLALGRDDCRPVPSGGACGLLTRIAAVDWQDGLLGGRQSIRVAALNFLERQPPVVMYAVEDWGLRGCAESCPNCCLIDNCDALLRGLV
jgi:hypothetical protein